MDQRRDYFLPQDLIDDILPRITPEATVRFRCLCKSWRRLLSDPKFIHRILQGESHESLQIIITKRRELKLIYCLLSDNLVPYATPLDGVYLQSLDVPVDLKGDPKIMGCCGGLLWITRKTSADATEVLLWNPSTSETKILPEVSRVLCDVVEVKRELIGFGFDSRTMDYKVVRMIRSDNMKVGVEVYSLRNNSWKEVGKIQQPNFSDQFRSRNFDHYSRHASGRFFSGNGSRFEWGFGVMGVVKLSKCRVVH
ncbi:F-box protein CPR1 [Linum grandiflorum]